jgi:hypothetical protein
VCEARERRRTMKHRPVVAVAGVALALGIAFAPSASAGNANPYVPTAALNRMQAQYRRPIALPTWLPTGYVYKGHVGLRDHSLTVGYVRAGRLIWFMLLNDFRGCTTSRWVRAMTVPGSKARRGCHPGAGLFYVWSHDAPLRQVDRIARSVRRTWSEQG